MPEKIDQVEGVTVSSARLAELVAMWETAFTDRAGCTVESDEAEDIHALLTEIQSIRFQASSVPSASPEAISVALGIERRLMNAQPTIGNASNATFIDSHLEPVFSLLKGLLGDLSCQHRDATALEPEVSDERIVAAACALARCSWVRLGSGDSGYAKRKYPGGVEEYVQKEWLKYAEDALAALTAALKPVALNSAAPTLGDQSPQRAFHLPAARPST